MDINIDVLAVSNNESDEESEDKSESKPDSESEVEENGIERTRIVLPVLNYKWTRTPYTPTLLYTYAYLYVYCLQYGRLCCDVSGTWLSSACGDFESILAAKRAVLIAESHAELS